MKLSHLLEKNQNLPHELGLKNNFGDHFLCHQNRIYASVRHAVLQAGFRFSHEQNVFYEALPLSQLEWILKNKQIPFCDNLSVLNDLETKAKNRILWDDICDHLKKNHLFHESCHGVARSIIASRPDLKEFGSGANVHQMGLFKIFLEESFANTCELMAVMDAADATHRIFFEWNSYICMFNERSHLLKAVADFGKSQIFQLMLLSYLCSNFQGDRFEEKEFQRVLDFVGFDSKLDTQQKKILRSLTKIAFELNPRFREVTTRFYLKTHGITTPMAELIDFDWMKLFEDNAHLKEMLTLNF